MANKNALVEVARKLSQGTVICALSVAIVSCSGGSGGDDKSSTGFGERTARVTLTELPAEVDGVPCGAARINNRDDVVLTCTRIDDSPNKQLRLLIWNPKHGVVDELPSVQLQAEELGYVRSFSDDRSVGLDIVTPGGPSRGLLVTKDGTSEIPVASVVSDGGTAAVVPGDPYGLMVEGKTVHLHSLPNGIKLSVPFSVNEKGQIGGICSYLPDYDHQFSQGYGCVVSEDAAYLFAPEGRPELAYSIVLNINDEGEMILLTGPGKDVVIPGADTSISGESLYLVKGDGTRVQLNPDIGTTYVNITDLNNRGYTLGTATPVDNLFFSGKTGYNVIIKPDGTRVKIDEQAAGIPADQALFISQLNDNNLILGEVLPKDPYQPVDRIPSVVIQVDGL